MKNGTFDTAILLSECQRTTRLVRRARALLLLAESASTRSFDLCVEADYLRRDRHYSLRTDVQRVLQSGAS